MSGSNASWFLGMVMGGALGSAIALSGNCALAQSNIVPDNTLGNESSVVIPNIGGRPIEVIDGGAQRGQNLFHSFQEFNVSNGRAAYFLSPDPNIQNILARVTGNNRSEILGTLGITNLASTTGNSNANLFLINPNGIIFGPNARLDVAGSFVATTANAIGFGNQGFFSATNPNTPPLLTVNPSALLYNQIRAASIENNSRDDLRITDGKSLLLVGGDINMNSGGLYALGGRVELGGLAGVGTVGLNGDGNNLSLSFPNSVERSNVSLSNNARVTVTAGNGGSIAVNARNLEMTGGSFLFAGIESRWGSDNSKAGNIEVNATGIINLNNQSAIANQVLPEANGQGGDVSISANTLRVEGGARVSTNTFGLGKGGNLTVDAQDVQLIGTSTNSQSSSMAASAQRNSTGDAGDLTIKTNTLLVKDGAQVFTSTSGSGKGGSLTIDAQDVQVIGRTADGRFASNLSASVAQNSTGNAGDLTIKTNTLLIKDGAEVFTSTFGLGKGGSLTVYAQDVQLIGTSTNGQFASELSAYVARNSTGDAGDLKIKTNTLLVKDGEVFTSTFGVGKGGNLTVDAQNVQVIGDGGLFASAQRNSTGDAGDLTIKTNTLLVKDGAKVDTSTYGTGEGGSLTIDAQDVQVIGTTANGRVASSLSASAKPNSTGDAGDLTIKTNTLLVKDGAQVFTSTSGSGKGGSLTVDAQDVQLIGTSNDGQVSSGLYASAQPNSTGDAEGDLIIKTNTLLVKDGAVVDTTTFGKGKGGNLSVDAQDVQLIGTNSGLKTSAQPNSTGDAGDLTIKTNTLLVKDGLVSTSTYGTGKGGSLTIDAQDVQVIGTSNDGQATSGLYASAQPNSTGDAGDLTIKTNTLLVKDGAAVSSTTFGKGKGGNLSVDAQDVQLIGTSSGLTNSLTLD